MSADFTPAYNRPAGRNFLRPIPLDTNRPAQFRYPDDRARLPQHCGHCGTRLLVSDIPTAEHPVTDFTCWICSRVAGELVYGAMPIIRRAR